MSDIGPALPPHLLAKRKRRQDEQEQRGAAADSGAKRSPSPGDGEKRRRIIGPAMPPAPLGERPTEPAVPEQDDSSDDENDFGPALPTAADATGSRNDDEDIGSARNETTIQASTERDKWMTMPPKQDDLAARMDPSKQRARGFNTGKGAKGPSRGGADNSAWHETPEQKRKRLEDEMMGISQPAAAGPQPSKPVSNAMDEAAAVRIREHTEKTRGPSLLEQHRGSSKAAEEDDPSKRAFDREKDMGSGMRINQTQRKEMLDKAGGFSSKFSGGSYL